MDFLSPIQGIVEFLLPFLDSVPIVRAILGFILVFFLPGFAWSLIFFRQVTVIERIVLSFGLSIALVTLSVLAMNMLFGVRISGFNSTLIIVLITVIPLAIFYIRKFIRRNRNVIESDG